MRLLEIEVLKLLHGRQRALRLDDVNKLAQVDVDQFYGIEIGEWPARSAEVALWLMDHQMNIQLCEAFGQYYVRLPLRKSPHIHVANALRVDWNAILSSKECSFVLGNPPFVGGNYLFTPDEKAEFLKLEPDAKPFFRRWVGSEEFIKGVERWCLWLGDCPPAQLRRMPHALARVAAVRKLRLASKSAATRKLADKPTRFHVENFPSQSYLVIPKVSSERRPYIPIGFLKPEIISSDLLLVVADATLYHFGALSSAMHMAWVRQVCGRLKSDYRYSAKLVYNNYPWPPSRGASL